MMRLIFTMMIGLVPSLLIGQVTKTNTTAGTVNGNTMTRTVAFTAGDLGGCTSLTDVNIALNWQGGAFQVVEQIAVSIQSPTGTIVHLVYDVQGILTGDNTQFSTYSEGGFGTWSTLTTTYDDLGGTIPGTPSLPQVGTWHPEENLSAFNGEDGTGTWTFTFSDAVDNAFGDDMTINTSAVTLTCAAACTAPDQPVVTATPSTICPSGSSTLTWTGNLNDATAWHIYTGSCGVTQLTTVTGNSLVVSPGSTTTYYIRGEDGAGCVDESTGLCGSATVTVGDVTNPTITCPANQSETPDAACNFTLPDYTGLATAADNCDASPALTQSPVAGTVVSANTVITLTVTDASSNTSSCNFSVLLNDVTPPTAVCQNINAYLDGAGNVTIVAADLDGGSTDNCAGLTLSASQTAFTCANLGPNNVTLTATDGNANSSNCVAVVTVLDTISPSAVCQNINAYLDGAGNASIVAADLDGGSVDNCGGVTISASQTAFTCADLGANPVTLTVTDGNTNTDNCIATVTVIDTISPSAVCQNINAYLDGAGDVTIAGSDLDGGSTDNCGALTFTASQTAFTCADLGPNNVTLTATDGIANTGTCVAVVTVLDTVSPVVTCPGNQTEIPNASCQFVFPDYTSLASATDNCGGTPTITQSPVAGTTISGTTTLTLTADDGNGNTSTCTFDVILNDAIPPTAVCQNISVFLDGAGNASIVASDLDGGSTDNCSGITLSASTTAFTCADLGANNVILTVTDGNSNTDVCTAVVTVLDTISPVITCPGDQTEIASTICNVIVPDYSALLSVTDNCAGLIAITQSPSAGTAISSNTTITFTAGDGNGNTSTCTFDVIIDFSACQGAECSNAIVVSPLDPCGDTEVLTGSTVGSTPNTESFFCGTPLGIGGAKWYTFTGDGGNWTASTVSSATNYDTKLWIYDGLCAALNCVTGNDDFSGVQSQVSFATTLGTTYYVVVGGYGSGVGSYELTITNSESVPPVPDVASLSDVNAVCEVTILTDPSATDNCSAVTVTNNATLPITANTTITWTYTDASGNFSTQTQNVVLTDLVAPTASNPADSTYECVGDAIIDVGVVTDEADNCTGAITVTHVSDVVTGNGCQDTITRTYNVADVSGNNIDVVQMIYIEDITAPTATNPTSLTVQCIGEVPAPVTGWVTDEADNCAVPTVAFVSDVSDGLSCPETITRTFSVTDACENSIDVVQMIIVMDLDAPESDIAALPELTSLCGVTPTTATATDNCDGTVDGTSDVTFPITALGTTTITWTYTDACGNSSTQTQDVTISAIDVSVVMASDNITFVANNFLPGSGVTYQWVDCDLDQPIANETNHNYTPTYGSNFAVIITENGCSDTSACLVSVVGIGEIGIKTLVLYPNPTSGMLTIDFEGLIKSIEVVDMLGRVISVPVSLEGKTVNGTQLSPGKYMIRITTDNDQILVEEFVVQK